MNLILAVMNPTLTVMNPLLTVMNPRVWQLLTLTVIVLLASCGNPPPPESVFTVADFRSDKNKLPRSRCQHFDENRSAWFGDLHVHTSYSNDAYSFGVRVDPDGAYRYAFGGPVRLPLGDDLEAREVRIDRPLDFAGVTDHAEFFGESELCFDESLPAYSTEFCGVFRTGTGREPALLTKIMAPIPLRDKEVCGDDGENCGRAAEGPWQKIIATAEHWNDTSDNCERTAFVAYEYSSFRLGSNLHRNVIFRNAVVPQRPISFLDAIREWDLWRILKERCLDGSEQCDVLAIPHNSNISNGRMFSVDYPGASSREEKAARARLRMEVEPIIEIMQHKGDSECRNGLSGVLGAVDELCDFEKFENLAFEAISGTMDVGDCYAGPLADYVPHMGPNCLTRNSYVRYALTEGLKQEQEIGVNPFKFGISASTDTHNGTGGGVQEKNYQGHLGNGDARAEDRVRFSREVAGNASNGPGGLIGIWAEENTRDSLFDGMRRKEVFGTSGPRIQPRFFGGWELAADLCEDPDMVARAYAEAVPMGADLPPRAGASPSFLVSALADGGSAAFPGTPLQRLQVIKGWADAEGEHHQAVFDVAGNPANGASVDLDSCATRGEGYTQLCSVWQDPEFDSAQRAVYYLRAVENPSCRYSTWQCLSIPQAERPADCAAGSPVRKIIQERAWSSPIWYSPS
jgi:hypothetical protein